MTSDDREQLTSRERLRDLENRVERLETFRALLLVAAVFGLAYVVLAHPGAVAGALKSLAED